MAELEQDPKNTNNKCFLTACKNNYIDIIKMLLKHPDVDPSINHNEAIREASSRGNIGAMKLLLKDPRVNPNDNFKTTPINEAIRNGHIKAVKLLMTDNRVRITIDKDDPLVVALVHEHANIAALLLNISEEKFLKSQFIDYFDDLF